MRNPNSFFFVFWGPFFRGPKTPISPRSGKGSFLSKNPLFSTREHIENGGFWTENSLFQPFFRARGNGGFFGPRNPLFQEMGIRAPVWGRGNAKLSGPLNRLNAVLSLLHPLEREGTASCDRGCDNVGRYFRSILGGFSGSPEFRPGGVFSVVLVETRVGPSWGPLSQIHEFFSFWACGCLPFARSWMPPNCRITLAAIFKNAHMSIKSFCP